MHNIIKILINGANGKMGRIAQTAIAEDPELNCICCCGRGDNLAAAIKQYSPDIVIDFTTPDDVYKNSLCIIENNARPIIGTSGLTQPQIKELQNMALTKKLGGLIAPNFSIAAVLMMRYAIDAAKYFNNVEITELHNISKKDAPSGTALHTAHKMQAENSKLVLHQSATEKQDGILIHSQRTPQQHAMQEVVLHSAHESLSIKAHCFDRTSYCHGIQLACHKVMQLQQLNVGLDNII
jgi:4-hydroxy-tetrahydrodipicolinate reductase